MQIIDVTRDNIAGEHICCAITEKKGETCVADKKAWMQARFDDGLVFKKLDVRGKVFIEYIPAEKAWVPVDATGYLYIDCLWVSGAYKKQGHGSALLDACIADARAKGKAGLVIISAAKKMPFLADPKFLKYKGFQLADTAAPYFELLYLPLVEGAPVPRFLPQAKEGMTDEKGIVLYYADQCPYTHTYAQKIQKVAEAAGREMVLHRMTATEQARSAPTAWPTYSLFMDGRFVTNEVLSEPKFAKMLEGAE